MGQVAGSSQLDAGKTVSLLDLLIRHENVRPPTKEHPASPYRPAPAPRPRPGPVAAPEPPAPPEQAPVAAFPVDTSIAWTHELYDRLLEIRDQSVAARRAARISATGQDYTDIHVSCGVQVM